MSTLEEKLHAYAVVTGKKNLVKLLDDDQTIEQYLTKMIIEFSEQVSKYELEVQEWDKKHYDPNYQFNKNIIDEGLDLAKQTLEIYEEKLKATKKELANIRTKQHE